MASWESSTEDFGQKVDLTVRIREILRNYPEGLSILKELIQNADDARARMVRFVVADARPAPTTSASSHSSSSAKLSAVMEGPSLLVYNSAKFTDTDFRSIQRLGDSLKRDKSGTKTGRFGVGVNSTYHLTDVPMFVSGSKVVLLDPQACHLPGVNPANPGKMIDTSTANGRELVDSLPVVFDPLRIFDCQLEGEEFDGTIFRFALRTEEQAKSSRLSRQAHCVDSMRELLAAMASAAPSMLLFLKNVECIEIYDWSSSAQVPTLVNKTNVSNADEVLRKKRAFILDAPTRVPSQRYQVDYVLDIESNGVGTVGEGGAAHVKEKWTVCNQLGGGEASRMASDPAHKHMTLVPWAGVAARLDPLADVDAGAAYCFLPLPVGTKLPIMINGYFELSSNRRDIWWGGDMAGDGKARAEWNRSLLEDVAAPSYCRLIIDAINAKNVSSETYEALFPQNSSVQGPWQVLVTTFFSLIRDVPVLYSCSASPNHWVTPACAILQHEEDNITLTEIIQEERLALVVLQSKELRKALMKWGACQRTSTPAFVRQHFSCRQQRDNPSLPGALENETKRIEYAAHLLKYCICDLDVSRFGDLAGCQFIPLANGTLGTFCSLSKVDGILLRQLESMGYSRLRCLKALRKAGGGNIDAAFEWLNDRASSLDDGASAVEPGIDPYLVCCGEGAAILTTRAASTFVDLNQITDPFVKKFFQSPSPLPCLNILPLESDMLADVVLRVLPPQWQGVESSSWEDIHPDADWFKTLWRYMCVCINSGQPFLTIAEQYCIVPTQQGLVCNLSPGASVIISSGIEDAMLQILVRLGVRVMSPGVLPRDIVVPEGLFNYIFKPGRDGVIRVIEAAVRRQTRRKEGGGYPFDDISDDDRQYLYDYLMDNANGSISSGAKAALKTFPIFRVYRDGFDKDTEFIAPLQSSTLYLLQNADDSDKTLMNGEFLAYKTNAEMEALVSTLKATILSRSVFFRRFILLQLADLEDGIRDSTMERILVDLPSLESTDPGFIDILRATQFVPSAEKKMLKAPIELYDPEVSQLRALMNPDSFPHESYCGRQMLLSIRSLGLQSTLTWDVVLECARSIEHDGTCVDGNMRESARERGRHLLSFLDMNANLFFPDLFVDKRKSTTSRFLSKVNAALFEDAEKKKQDTALRTEQTQKLMSTKWMPVLTEPPNPILPWQKNLFPVAAPNETSELGKMWLVSYSRRLADGSVQSDVLKGLFGWNDAPSIVDIAAQLKMFGLSFPKLKSETSEEHPQDVGGEGRGCVVRQGALNVLSQTITSEIPRLYQALDSVEDEYDRDQVKFILHDSPWLWTGCDFVKPNHCAFSSSLNAAPYLYTIPPDIVCFRNLLNMFGVRPTFRSTDFVMVLQRMAGEGAANDHKWSTKQINLAVNLVQAVSDEATKVQDMDIYAPSEDNTVVLASSLTYDDAPWLSKDLPSKKGALFSHPKLSPNVAERVGIKSLRRTLVQNSSDMISFGDGNVHGEAFGQSESLTRRLSNIIELYPEGTQQLCELIQNADDARATVIKFVVSKKKHGSSSLLGQKLSAWQGPALLSYNDSTFTDRDFQNLSRIGQASKLNKLDTTGRFGLGFNSVFHWTDVPSLVSRDYLVMFDPHAKYVPGATSSSRGIKIRFAGSSLREQFPDQMAPYRVFGCDMKHSFQGTLFRFPFRSATTAPESEISSNRFEGEAIDELLDNFRDLLPRTLLFLRHVKRIEMYEEGPSEDDCPKLLYYGEVAGRKNVMEKEPISLRSFAGLGDSVFSTSRSAKSSTKVVSGEWNAVSSFVVGSHSSPNTKEEFYSKLSCTPESQLPKTKHVVTIQFVGKARSSVIDVQPKHSAAADDEGIEVEFGAGGANETAEEILVDEYLVCTGLGGGSCRDMACNPSHHEMKFIPWGGVAAHLTRNAKDAPKASGYAFSFLPLPVDTGLPVIVNGYFELSANRRDIWHGGDMSGKGRIQSEWNKALLTDVIAPMYAQLLQTASQILGPGNRYNNLWPVAVTSHIWSLVKQGVYHSAYNMPLMYSIVDGGRWVTPSTAIFLDATESSEANATLMNILLQEQSTVVSVPTLIIEAFRNDTRPTSEVTPAMIRNHYKSSRSSKHHPSLQSIENAIFLLQYCCEDLRKGHLYDEMDGLPLVPLCSGGLGVFQGSDYKDYFISTELERRLLCNAENSLVDTWTSNEWLNSFLKSTQLQEKTNLSPLDRRTFVRLLSSVYPTEWSELEEIRWTPDREAKRTDGIRSEAWLQELWDFIAAESQREDNEDKRHAVMNDFTESWQILPTLVGDKERTLMRLSNDLFVMSLINVDTGNQDISDEVASILWQIGIRTLDASVFSLKNRRAVLQSLDMFVEPPTVPGFLGALVHSFPVDIDHTDLLRRVALRFKLVPDDSRERLRRFIREDLCRNCAGSSYTLSQADIKMLRTLPIYRIYGTHDGIQLDGPASRATFAYGDLLGEKFLPPVNADSALLGSDFVSCVNEQDERLLELLGVSTIGTGEFYEVHACPAISKGTLSSTTRDAAIYGLLQEVPSLLEQNGHDWCERMSTFAFIPNRGDKLVKPSDLYNPNEPDLSVLLDDSMLPAMQFSSNIALASLRLLGMRTTLTHEGIIAVARSIENITTGTQQDPLNNAKALSTAKKRALSLVRFLDREDRMASLLDEARHADSGHFVSRLIDIAWLPVGGDDVGGELLGPPRRSDSHDVFFASPSATRPIEDQWMCSNAMEVSAVAIRSPTLIQSFGWDKPVPIIIVAKQLLALADMHRRHPSSQNFRQILAKVVPRCYDLLNCHLESASVDEQEKISVLLCSRPWLFVGDRFVSSDQVALTAPEGARPYLYKLPSEARCFESLLKVCGVRQSFTADDYAKLSQSLGAQAGRNAATNEQVDLAIFIARYLCRLPHNEYSGAEKGEIFLPSNDKRLHRAKYMTYDDAPWLSAIVTGKTRERYVFVHGDVGNDVARQLGAQSLRDVLSAGQNGMATIPCPRASALAELHGKEGIRREWWRVIFDIIEIAEMRGVKRVSIALDGRSHGTMSLLHPSLAAAQGPAIVVCLHGEEIEVDEVVKLTSPSRFYSSSISGQGGCGGHGYTRYGSGLCGAFLLGDCLQVLSGGSLMFFDPIGEYLIDYEKHVNTDTVDGHNENSFPTPQTIGAESNSESTRSTADSQDEKESDTLRSDEALEKGNSTTAAGTDQVGSDPPREKRIRKGLKASARNYGMSAEFSEQFPHQLEPFLTLPYGVRDSFSCGSSSPDRHRPNYHGTIFRIPLRHADSPASIISNQTFDSEDMTNLQKMLESRLSTSLLFTYHLQSIVLDICPTERSNLEAFLRTRVSSSPIARRSHIDEMTTKTDWKKKSSKLKKLFTASWVPHRTSHTVQITTSYGKAAETGENVVETYVIQSILAPPRLREMACTEALKPLKILPCISLAANVHTVQGGKVDGTNSFTTKRSNLFVGLDTGIDSGLPFIINAPLFLHEQTGNLLLKEEDDKDLRRSIPTIRNVRVQGRSGNSETRALALHVWNAQALSSAMKELVPPLLNDLRDPIRHIYSKDPHDLYRFWPFKSSISKDIVDNVPFESMYEELAKRRIYLTCQEGFQDVSEGYFASAEYPMSDVAAKFFYETLSLFHVPHSVAQDLCHFAGVEVKRLTPAAARKLLKQSRCSQLLSRRPDEALALLEYCLADVKDCNDFRDNNSQMVQCQKELQGLSLIPLADNSVGSIGRQMILADALQQQMIPSIMSKFCAPNLAEKLQEYMEKPHFLEFIGITRFGPQTLANYISTMLPQLWEGRDFVTWNDDRIDTNEIMICDQVRGPSQLWLHRFWKEVKIWDHDAVQLFGRWPLIPMKGTGELASCGNARFILYFCPSAEDEGTRRHLAESSKRIEARIEEESKRTLIRHAAEERAVSVASNQFTIVNQTFWSLGDRHEADSGDRTDGGRESSNEEESVEPVAPSDIRKADEEESSESASTSLVELDMYQAPRFTDDSATVADTTLLGAGDLAYEANSASFNDLLRILSVIRCPLLEAGYFSLEDANKMLPQDRLSVARRVLVTLSHCTNYWTMLGEEFRLHWGAVDSSELDELLLLLTQHNGIRLSLMPSDMSMLKQLALFETLSGSRISLSGSDDNYTVNSTVDIEILSQYLQESLRGRFLVDKAPLRSLFVDLGVEKVNEANILRRFVLPYFTGIPSAQKEAVCQSIFSKWTILKESSDFVNTLESVPFVKRKGRNGEIVFVQPSQLLNPHNNLLSKIFDKDRSNFPAEEFASEEWIAVLLEVGMKKDIDKDSFLMAAYQVEHEQSTAKAMTLLTYYNEHFAELIDLTQEFGRQLAAVRFVPAEFDGAVSLFYFRDVAVAKDRHITFKVLPVLQQNITPPQLMFSSLGIVSPPSLETVLRQIELLTDEKSLDHWHYRHGSVDEVFNDIFSHIQENFDRLSSTQRDELRTRPLVPVGTALVKTRQLFFRLAKDLAPFFYEVPRAFGRHDKLFTALGVRESPQPDDYARSLQDLKQDAGRVLDINELQSSIEVVNLVVAQAKSSGRQIDRTMLAPSVRGELVTIDSLYVNDRPWLVNSGRLDCQFVHLAHPKLTPDVCRQLGIRCLSECLEEIIEDGFTPNLLRVMDECDRLQMNIRSHEFVTTVAKLCGCNSQRNKAHELLKTLTVYMVESIRTRFILINPGDSSGVDITKDNKGTFCYIDGTKVLLSSLPAGFTPELAVAAAICDALGGIDRNNVAGLAVMLAADKEMISYAGTAMGITAMIESDEMKRGEPGVSVIGDDLNRVELKPLKIYTKGEIVAVKKKESVSSDGLDLVYGIVVDCGGGNSLSRVCVRAGGGETDMLLSSDIYSICKPVATANERANEADKTQRSREPRAVNMSLLRNNQEHLVENSNLDSDLEATLLRRDSTDQRINSVNAPIDRGEILGAVDDLLESAGLSLRDDAKDVINANLELRDELTQKDTYIASLINEGRSLSSELCRGTDAFLCPITREIMVDPVICADGHSYEREAIEMWLRSNRTSPKTNRPLSSSVLIPNHALRATIESSAESVKAVKQFKDTFD